MPVSADSNFASQSGDSGNVRAQVNESVQSYHVNQKVQVYDADKWWDGIIKRKFRRILSKTDISSVWFYTCWALSARDQVAVGAF